MGKGLYEEIRNFNKEEYGRIGGKKSGDLATELYSNKDHFIYELLQNAEDACSRKKRIINNNENFEVSFSLLNNRLEFSNNGVLFNEKDIKAICNILEGTKKDDSTQIGRFGIGFKSVCIHTDYPEVHSGNYSFFIKDHVFPSEIKKSETLKENETLFILPFKNPIESFNSIKDKLKDIGNTTLLFLDNLSKINWNINDESGEYIKKVENISENIKYVELTQVSKNSAKTINSEKWLVFRKNGIVYDKEYKTEIAYKISKNKLTAKDYIDEVKNVTLSVFFPTNIKTDLKFIIQGSYETTPARDNIKENNAYNNYLIEETGKLVSDSISFLKNIDLLDARFLNILPLDNENDYYIYKPIYFEVNKKLSSKEKLLPTNDNDFSNKNNTLIADSKKLRELLDSKDLDILFKKNGYKWLSSEITREKNQDLYKYLSKNLQVQRIDDSKFINNISIDFLKQKKDDWLIKFYSFLKELGIETLNRLDIFNKPIVKLEDSNFISPKTIDGKNNCYIYSEIVGEKTKYNIIKKIITDNSDALYFFKSILGIEKVDVFSEINEYILPKYKEESELINQNEYFEDFSKIINSYNKNTDEFKRKLKDIASFAFIISYDNKTNKKYLKKAENIYFPTDILSIYFKDYNVFFLDIENYKSFDNFDNFIENTLNITKYPKIIEENGLNILTKEEKSVIIGNTHWVSDSLIENKSIEGLESFLFNLKTLDDSLLLWELIFNLNNFSYLKGKYSWDSGNKKPTTESFDSKLVKLLQENNWLLKNNNTDVFYKPSDIMFSDVNDKYNNIEIDNKDFKDMLLQKLNFKQNIDIKSSLSEQGKNRVEELEEKEKKLELLENLAKEKGYSSTEEFLNSITAKKLTVQTESPIISNSSSVSTKNDYFYEDDNDLLPDYNQSKIEDAAYIADENGYYTSEENEDNNKVSNYENKPSKTYIHKTQAEIIEKDLNKHKHKIESEQEKIELLEKMKTLEESIKSLTKYTFKWFKELLELEYLLSEGKSSNKKELSINFSKVEKLSGSFILLRNPDKFIPNSIEDIGDITLKIKTKSGKKSELTIDVVQMKDNAIKAKLKSGKDSNEFNFNEIISAEINISNLLFILEELKEKFSELPFSDEDNLKDFLPETLEFVFGPPGTGKTTHISKELISIMKENKKVLVLTPTNKASDVIIKKIISENNDKVPNWLVRFGSTSDNDIEELGILKDKDFNIENLNKSVVVTTIARFPYNKIGDVELKDYNWDIVIFDEASMIPISSIIYAILKSENAIRLIVAGDPLQIPPIVHSEEWKDENIYTLVELNNFENTTTKPKDFHVHRLMKQYRSIESIGNLFSTYSYNGLLEHSKDDSYKRELNIKGKKTKEITFIKFPEDKEQRLKKVYTLNKSPYHIYSALLSFEFAINLKKEIESQWGLKNINNSAIYLDKFDEFDLDKLNNAKWTIGIISPYKQQSIIIDRLINSSIDSNSNVSVISGSVHSFQGDECDIIITLLNPPKYNSPMAHINNKKLLNVAISRAKNYLFVMIPNGYFFQEINEILNIAKESTQNNYEIYESKDIEKLLFNNQKFIEENTFLTSHQNVNVYTDHAYKYEVRNKESLIGGDGDTIDIHLKTTDF